MDSADNRPVGLVPFGGLSAHISLSMKFFRGCIVLALMLGLVGTSIADDSIASDVADRHALSLPAVIVDTWARTVQASKAEDLKAVNTFVAELDRLKLQADISALDSYALFMVRQGQVAFKKGDRETAAFYARKALQLSPRSPVVLAISLPLVRQTGTASTASQVMKIAQQFWRHPNVALRVVKHAIYPALLALTLGVLVALALTFAFKAETLFRGLSRAMPTTLRGLATPFLMLIVLAAPLCIGPLWTLFVWSLCLYLILPQHRWLGFAAGTLLALWGTVLPIRESLKSWLEDPGIQAMLDVASGVFSASDKAKLEALSHERSNDGPLFFALGQVLRRHGEYKRADEAFLRAEMLLGAQPWTLAQRAVTAYLDGRLESSDQLFKEAEAAGISSAEFYFNYSKTKFELMDTTSARIFLTRAIQKDRDLAKSLEAREQMLGTQSRLAIAEIQLPFYRVLSSALSPTTSIRQNYEGVANALMPGCTPPHILSAGVLLICCFFLIRKRKSRTVPLSSYPTLLPARALRHALMLIPGGAWIRAERPVWCFIIISACALLVMPLLEWPMESRFLVDVFPELMPYYVCFVSLFALCACYVGAHLESKS